MKEENIYQQALADAITQQINAEKAVKEHLERLAVMKAEKVYRACIGKQFRSEDLGYKVTVIAVGYHISEDIWKTNGWYRISGKDMVQIKIAFAVDVENVLGSKKGVTETERKQLKKIKSKVDNVISFREYDKKFYRYSSYDPQDYDEIYEIKSSLEDLKNKLKVIDAAVWSYSISDVLSDNFLEKGMSYDGQTIC